MTFTYYMVRHEQKQKAGKVFYMQCKILGYWQKYTSARIFWFCFSHLWSFPNKRTWLYLLTKHNLSKNVHINALDLPVLALVLLWRFFLWFCLITSANLTKIYMCGHIAFDLLLKQSQYNITLMLHVCTAKKTIRIYLIILYECLVFSTYFFYKKTYNKKTLWQARF